MNHLPVSVVIPTYNRAHLIERAIRSALANTQADDEIIVADDASKDNTAEVVRSFGDRVRYLPCEHGGAGATRNKGIRAATRPLVAFLDSDDEWMPDKLTLQRAFMERQPNVLFCFSNFTVKEGGEEKPGFLVFWHRDDRPWDQILGPGVPYSSIAPLPVGRPDFRVHMGNLFLPELLSDYVATTTLVVRREAAGDALAFAEDLPTCEDKECFARLAQKGTAAYFDCDLSYQWAHTGARLTDLDQYQFATARIKLIQRVWGQDARFLAEHEDEYRGKLRQQYLLQARCLLARGRSAEARQSLRQAGDGPWTYRLLAALPGPVTRGILGLRRVLRLGGD